MLNLRCQPGRRLQRPGYCLRPLLLDGEYPNDAALRHVILHPNIITGRQCVLDALRVDAPPRLDGDIFRPIDFIRDWHAHDAGVGFLLPQQFACLGMKGTEHPVIRTSDQDEIAGGSRHRTKQLRFWEIIRPDLLPGGRIPRLQLAVMIGAGTNLQTDIFGLRPEPKLTRIQGHLLAGKAAAEILVGRNVDEAGLLAIRRRWPILAAPQRRTEFNPLANTRLVVRVDDGPAGLRLNSFPDIGRNERPAGDIVDAVGLALEYPEDGVAAGMNQALERAAIPLQVDQHGCVHLVPIPGIVLMVLVKGLYLTVLGIEPQHRGG